MSLVAVIPIFVILGFWALIAAYRLSPWYKKRAQQQAADLEMQREEFRAMYPFGVMPPVLMPIPGSSRRSRSRWKPQPPSSSPPPPDPDVLAVLSMPTEPPPAYAPPDDSRPPRHLSTASAGTPPTGPDPPPLDYIHPPSGDPPPPAEPASNYVATANSDAPASDARPRSQTPAQDADDRDTLQDLLPQRYVGSPMPTTFIPLHI